MKKFMSLAVALVAAVVVSSSAFAASTQFTARATFAGAASFSFTLKNISGDATATDLTWAEADAFNMTGTDSWVRALQYAEVVANITKANASVKMYTDNKGTWSNIEPNYNDWEGEGDNAHGVVGTEAYGGLVRNDNGNLPADFVGAHRGYIPLLYSMNTEKNASITSDGSEGTKSEDANHNPTRADRFLADVSNGGYGDGSYAIIASLNGPTFGVDNTTGAYSSKAVTNNTAYMYFFGNFKNIIGGDTYSTTVKVQQSWE